MNSMSTFGTISRNVVLGTKHLDSLSTPTLKNAIFSASYGQMTRARCAMVSARMNSHESWRSNMLYKFFWSNATTDNPRSKPSPEGGNWDSERFCTESYPSGVTAAADVDADGAVQEEQVDGAPVGSDKKSPGERTVKMVCGSCYLPHPSKEATGGEDAFFICADKQAIGVADGVGGWALHGIDAGEYARELMSNAVSAIKEEPNGFIDPARVLEKAYTRTKKVGSSTACIIVLTDQVVNAVNLGDSGFMVIREGSTVFQSPSQQHDFNFPYQLDAGGMGDLPRDAQVFTVPVAPGDVIVAGTDGLFDNLYAHEVAEVVTQSVRAKLGPQATAQKIAAFARERAMDKTWRSPFSAAAEGAGFYFVGGKLDDISVVVSYVTAAPGDDS